MWILTAKLLEVSLQLLAGAEEDPSLFSAHHEGALLMDGDAGHLCVQLGECQALLEASGQHSTGWGSIPASHPLPFPSGIFSSHQKILPSKAVFWFMSEFHGFMTSLKSFGDFTALQKYPAGKQELLTHHFISLFPILKRNILLHFFKRKHSCKKKSNEKTTPQLITICVFPPALME